MFTLKGCNKRIDRTREILLKLILNDYDSSFHDLLSNLTLCPRALFLNSRKNTGNFAVLVCCAAVN